MSQFDGSHEEFDYFVVPAVSEKKQQIDTVNTIETLAALGVPRRKSVWCSTRSNSKMRAMCRACSVRSLAFTRSESASR